MSFAVLTINTTLSATMEDLYSDPGGTHSFSFTSGTEEELFILDDDATFNDIDIGDTNQIVAPASTIFLDNTPIASRHKFIVTPDNGDPAFTVYVVFENSTSNDDFSAINSLNYALVSETPLFAQHQIIAAEDVAAESFYPGPNAMRALGREKRAEIARVLEVPHGTSLLAAFKPARRFCNVQETKRLLAGGAPASRTKDPVNA